MPSLQLISANEVEIKEVQWLWYPYVPYGKITLLQGDSGDGKSCFVLALCALLTSGKPLPFQSCGQPPISVIYQKEPSPMIFQGRPLLLSYSVSGFRPSQAAFPVFAPSPDTGVPSSSPALCAARRQIPRIPAFRQACGILRPPDSACAFRLCP